MLMRSGKPLARTRDDRLGGLHTLEASFANFQQSVGDKARMPVPMSGFRSQDNALRNFSGGHRRRQVARVLIYWLALASVLE